MPPVAHRVRRARRSAPSCTADGLKALAFVVIGIMAYLAFRFEWKFSVAAIVANLHDVVIILGLLRLLPVGVLARRCWPRCWRCWATRSTSRS